MPPLPLTGVRIIDMTVVWAGPFATLFLSDLGAEVVRVESLQHADINGRGDIRVPRNLQRARTSSYPDGDPGDRPFERNAGFNNHGRNKVSMTVDYMTPEGKEIFYRLVAASDAFIENNAAGVMDKLGFGWDVLSKVNPRLVMMSMPGFGSTGPYRHFKGYGANMEGVVGHTSLRGYADMDYTGATLSLHSDAASGASGAFAIMAAIHHARRTGKGQFIDVSQAENVVHHLSQALMDFSMNGRVHLTLGNRDPQMAPHGVYPCAGTDKWVAIAVATDDQFRALCDVMGQPELAGDPRFADVVVRHTHQDELDPLIGEWTKQYPHYEVFHRLQAAKVPASPLLRHDEAFDDPQLQARGFFEQVTSPATGTHWYPGPLFKFDATPLHIRSAAPTLGQHNEYMYKTVLGYSDAEYEELVRKGHIGDTYVELLREAAAGGR